MALQNAFENLAVESKQLPDGHGVTVSNQIDQPLTDAELRAEPIEALNVSCLVPTMYDDIQIVYTGNNITSVIYRSETVVVATLTLTYTGEHITRVVRT